MKIGFDAKRLFHNFTGLGNYSRTLVSNLAALFPENIYHLFTPSVSDQSRTKSYLSNPQFHIHTPDSGRFLWRTWRMNRDLRKTGIDLYHGLSHELPLNIKPPSGYKTIVTIHDLIFRLFPHHYALPDRKIYDLKCAYSCRNADHIIAISEQTKRDIIRYYNIASEKISVIYQSCDPMFYEIASVQTRQEILRKYQLPSEYILCVGSVTERKNLLTIIQAIRQMNDKNRVPLVVIGEGGSYKRKVLKYISENRLDKWVIFVPNLYYPDLPAIYQAAQIFVYPSLYEGFGIPVIEALISKTPVITSNTSSLPEAAGPDSICIDPLNTELFTFHIQNILQDSNLGNQMREKGVLYSERFHFSEVTKLVMQLYRATTGMD
ncbi:MAG: glycosyltransferase family 1 protein [Bacteroidia bacterium]|nr:glycosyltransferase family 1 protein [Bacteroidia bacterium]